MQVDKVKNKIISYFKYKKEVDLVYLFGSMAKNQLTSKSDIDLAVLFTDEKINQFSLQGKYTEELTGLFDKNVDVVNLNASDAAFSYRVVSEGKLVYERNKTAGFHLIIGLIRRYFDLKPGYDLFYRQLGRRVRKGII